MRFFLPALSSGADSASAACTFLVALFLRLPGFIVSGDDRVHLRNFAKASSLINPIRNFGDHAAKHCSTQWQTTVHYIHIYVYMYICTYEYVYMYMYICIHTYIYMIMIALITIKSSLVPLIEGLCAIYVHIHTYIYIYICI